MATLTFARSVACSHGLRGVIRYPKRSAYCVITAPHLYSGSIFSFMILLYRQTFAADVAQLAARPTIAIQCKALISVSRWPIARLCRYCMTIDYISTGYGEAFPRGCKRNSRSIVVVGSKDGPSLILSKCGQAGPSPNLSTVGEAFARLCGQALTSGLV